MLLTQPLQELCFALVVPQRPLLKYWTKAAALDWGLMPTLGLSRLLCAPFLLISALTLSGVSSGDSCIWMKLVSVDNWAVLPSRASPSV